MLGSASEGSPNAEGLSTGTASETASIGAIGSRGLSVGAARLHLIGPGGDTPAGDNRDGSPESKWATADLLGSPRRDAAGSGVAPPVWQATSTTDGGTGGAVGRAVGLPLRPSESIRTSSLELQTARSMSVDAGTPRAHATPPSTDPFQHRLQTPEQREHDRCSRAAVGGAGVVTASQGGRWIPPLKVRLMLA